MKSAMPVWASPSVDVVTKGGRQSEMLAHSRSSSPSVSSCTLLSSFSLDTLKLQVGRRSSDFPFIFQAAHSVILPSESVCGSTYDQHTCTSQLDRGDYDEHLRSWVGRASVNCLGGTAE